MLGQALKSSTYYIYASGLSACPALILNKNLNFETTFTSMTVGAFTEIVPTDKGFTYQYIPFGLIVEDPENLIGECFNHYLK